MDINQRPTNHLLSNFEDITEDMLRICRAKNSDYSGASPDPYQNFSQVERLGICKVEQGFLTRMTDKLCRISSLVKKGSAEVKDESIEDTLIDLANYSIIMLCYLRSKKEEK